MKALLPVLSAVAVLGLLASAPAQAADLSAAAVVVASAPAKAHVPPPPCVYVKSNLPGINSFYKCGDWLNWRVESAPLGGGGTLGHTPGPRKEECDCRCED